MILENLPNRNYAEIITETTFKIDEHKKLAGIIRNELGVYWTSDYENHYAHMVYIDCRIPIVLYLTTNAHIKNLSIPQICFADQLKNINTNDLKQLTILLTCFSDLKNTLNLNINKPIPLIDALFVESNGWLVYRHQLENLFRIATRKTQEEATKFVRDINKKNINGYTPFLNVSICGTTLGQIMKERMLTEFVLYPDSHTAIKLYSYLNKKQTL
jgi:hypothetical protein